MTKLSKEISGIRDGLKKPVALIGMMGAGKSYLGRALADSLSMDFIDSDSVIEERAGITTSEIFEHYGEDKFRDFEFKVIEDISAGKPLVLSTGGGAPTHEPTFEVLLDQCVVIWLNAELDLMWSRVEHSKSRPKTLRTLWKSCWLREHHFTGKHISRSISHSKMQDAQRRCSQKHCMNT